jgi:murein DD-endopeptidase / murein LD-carboxypeptidase
LKTILYLSLIVLFFTSCKPSSAIITSKKEAQNKKIYTVPVAKKSTKKREKIIVQSTKEITEKPKISEVNESDYIVNPTNSSYLVDQLIHSAFGKIGIKYRWGGTTDRGFDCSGLMYNIFNLYYVNIPRSSIKQAKLGTVIEKENVQKGDLIFFRTNGRKQINHVGMVVEILENEIKFIHSSTSSGVIISSTKEPYYQKSFAQINRVVE